MKEKKYVQKIFCFSYPLLVLLFLIILVPGGKQNLYANQNLNGITFDMKEFSVFDYEGEVNYYRLKAVASNTGCKPAKVHLLP